MSQNIPLVPGLSPSSRAGPNGNTQHHAFDFKNGFAVHKNPAIAVPPTANPTPVNRQPKVRVESSHANPNWLKYDNVVLRFYATCKEPVLERQYQGALSESTRVRKVTIYYYMATGEIHIEEEKIENSGMGGGRFLNRMVVHGPDGVTPLQPKDFQIGKEIAIHNHVFEVHDADPLTREFLLATYGVRSGAPTPVAEDEWRRHQRAVLAQQSAGTPKCQITAYEEVANGGFPKETLERSRQWVKHQGEVLRFWAVWKDASHLGRKHEYIVHYFLADDTIEVRMHNKVDGEAHFPLMFSRAKLKKAIPSLEVDGIGVLAKDCVNHKDLRVGKTLSVLGRDLLLTCADNYTIGFYKRTHALRDEDFAPIDISSPEPPKPRNATPPPTGYGTEEDSLRSCEQLVPRPPKKNFDRMLKWGNTCARFLAKFAQAKNADVGRRFVISVFLADDTVGIYEKELVNSGIPTGKFIERTRLRNPTTGAYFAPEDFVVGCTVTVNHFQFEILKADCHNANLTNAVTTMPVDKIIRDMAQSAWFGKVSNITHTFINLDDSGDAKLDKEEFGQWLSKYGYVLDPEKLTVLFEKFDDNHDGTISLSEFMKRVEEEALLSPRGYN